MEAIEILDAKSRLGELLKRTISGETFEIIQDGRPAAWLVPPHAERNREASTAAAQRLKAMRGILGKISQDELKNMIHEGHRF